MMPSDRAPDVGSENKVSPGDDNPYAGRIVKHQRFGVWDWYEERDPDGVQLISPSSWGQSYYALSGSFHHVVRAVKDLLSIPGCKAQFAIYLATGLGAALIPAAAIW